MQILYVDTVVHIGCSTIVESLVFIRSFKYCFILQSSVLSTIRLFNCVLIDKINNCIIITLSLLLVISEFVSTSIYFIRKVATDSIRFSAASYFVFAFVNAVRSFTTVGSSANNSDNDKLPY
jgi:hypothetical protein